MTKCVSCKEPHCDACRDNPRNGCSLRTGLEHEQPHPVPHHGHHHVPHPVPHQCECEDHHVKQRFYRSKSMTTTVVTNGSWVESTSFTSLFLDKALTKHAGIYTEKYSKSEAAGAYFFQGNLCFDGHNNHFITFGENNAIVLGKKSFTNPAVISSGKMVGKHGSVKTLISGSVDKVSHTVTFKL